MVLLGNFHIVDLLFGKRVFIFGANHIPKIIAKTNSAPWLLPKLKEATAGPGHKPAKPQPIPKRADPIMRSRLISELGGAGNSSPNNGFRPCEYFQAKNIGTIAPPITNASVGSQSPNTSSHPCTFEVSVIPENKSPIPKRDPEIKAVKTLIRLYSKHDETLKL
jgi:hypothetical protein